MLPLRSAAGGSAPSPLPPPAAPPPPPAEKSPTTPATFLLRPKMGKSLTQNGAGRLTAAHALCVPRAAAAAGRRRRPHRPPPSLSSPPHRVAKRRPAPIRSRRCSSCPPVVANHRAQSYIRIQLLPITCGTTVTSLQLPPIGWRSGEAPIKSLRGPTCVDGWPMLSAGRPVTNGGAVRGAQSGRGRAPGASRGGQWEFKQDRFCSTACYWARRW